MMQYELKVRNPKNKVFNRYYRCTVYGKDYAAAMMYALEMLKTCNFKVVKEIEVKA